MHASLLVVFFFLGRPFVVVVANPVEITDSGDLFGSSFDIPILPILPEDEILSEQYPTNDVDLFNLSTDSTNPAELSAGNPSCSTNNVERAFDSSPLDDLWVREEVAQEEDLMLDSPVFAISAGAQCVDPAQKTNPENPKPEELQIPKIQDLLPQFFPEEKRGRCIGGIAPDWFRWIAACCGWRDGQEVRDCVRCTYNTTMRVYHSLFRPGLSEALHITEHTFIFHCSPIFPPVIQWRIRKKTDIQLISRQ